MLEKIETLVRQKDICVLSTVSGNRPHCSLMAYVTEEDCRTLYMVTLKTTQKYRNLRENPHVSLLIDTREENMGSVHQKAKALTVSGIFHEIVDEREKSYVKAKLLERHPHLEEFVDHPQAALLCIKVSAFLLLDGLVDAHFERVPE